MLFDLRRLVTTFTKHVGGYNDLVAIEASVAARSVKTRLVLAIAAVAFALNSAMGRRIARQLPLRLIAARLLGN